MKKKIAFMGAGKMASAIVKGLIKKSIYRPESILCTCGNDSTGAELAKETGIGYAENLLSHRSEIDILFLACKPQQLDQIDLSAWAERTAARDLSLISILAGTTLKELKKRFPFAINHIRTMPNTPGQIGLGSTAYTSLIPLEAKQQKHIEAILGALGSVHLVDESALDAITALSGSGPAYVFEFIVALIEGGVQAGLDERLAQQLAMETVLGSAELLRTSSLSAEDLRKAVTSPGGTTEAALEVLKNAEFKTVIHSAILRAKERSIELSEH
ncbi:MAG: pyrroline-5-carboxylate reductase [Puniceicoccaceae bacterium]|nr:pyrroline-5-carboxylate reductase [Puniceicoccaceae bacterium]